MYRVVYVSSGVCIEWCMYRVVYVYVWSSICME